MRRAELQLETVTCPSCIKKIETALNKIDGIDSVKVLFNSSKVKAEFEESKISLEKLERTVASLGYEILSSKVF